MDHDMDHDIEHELEIERSMQEELGGDLAPHTGHAPSPSPPPAAAARSSPPARSSVFDDEAEEDNEEPEVDGDSREPSDAESLHSGSEEDRQEQEEEAEEEEASESDASSPPRPVSKSRKSESRRKKRIREEEEEEDEEAASGSDDEAAFERALREREAVKRSAKHFIEEMADESDGEELVHSWKKRMADVEEEEGEDAYEMDSTMDAEDVITYESDFAAKLAAKRKEKAKNKKRTLKRPPSAAQLQPKKRSRVQLSSSSSSEAEEEDLSDASHSAPPSPITVSDQELERLRTVGGTAQARKLTDKAQPQPAAFYQYPTQKEGSLPAKDKPTSGSKQSSAPASSSLSSRKKTPHYMVGDLIHGSGVDTAYLIRWRGEDTPLVSGHNGRQIFDSSVFHPNLWASAERVHIEKETGIVTYLGEWAHFSTNKSRRPSKLSEKFIVTQWNTPGLLSLEEKRKYAQMALDHDNFLCQGETKRMILCKKLYELIKKQSHKDEHGRLLWQPPVEKTGEERSKGGKQKPTAPQRSSHISSSSSSSSSSAPKPPPKSIPVSPSVSSSSRPSAASSSVKPRAGPTTPSKKQLQAKPRFKPEKNSHDLKQMLIAKREGNTGSGETPAKQSTQPQPLLPSAPAVSTASLLKGSGFLSDDGEEESDSTSTAAGPLYNHTRISDFIQGLVENFWKHKLKTKKGSQEHFGQIIQRWERCLDSGSTRKVQMEALLQEFKGVEMFHLLCAHAPFLSEKIANSVRQLEADNP